MVLFMMAGKLVDIIPTVTGEGFFRTELQRKPSAVATARSLNWGRREQYAGLILILATLMVCSLAFKWRILDTSLRR